MFIIFVAEMCCCLCWFYLFRAGCI